MDRFWKWLMQANARGVFVATVAALALVTGWWVRQEINPPDDGGPVGGGGARRPKAHPRLEVLDYVREQLAVDATLVPETPFRPARKRRVRRVVKSMASRLPPPPAPGKAPPSDPDETIVTGPAVRLFPPAGPHAIASGPKSVTLVYHGLFKRSDGHTLALIEDSESRRRLFRDTGGAVDGYGTRVIAISPGSITLATNDGETIELPRGQPTNFVEGHHVKQPDNPTDP
jgi:hypothetical protein